MRYYDVNEEEKFIKKFFKQAKKIIDEANGIDASEKEVREVLQLMKTLATISLDQVKKDFELEQRLIKEPKGFLMDKDYGEGCCICGSWRGDYDRWYDSNGIKCMICQKALESNLIPVSVATDKESYYSDTELKDYFNLEGKVLTEWIRAKLLKCRIIRNENGGRYFRLYLMQDNEGFLPPKRLLVEASQGSGEPWYCCVDPFEYLKDYGIIGFLRPVPSDPGELEKPQTAPEPPKVELCNPCTFPATTPKRVKRRAKRKHIR